MEARMELKNTDKIEATLVMTMTLGEWKDLNAELGRAWPASVLSQRINDVVLKATAIFWSEK